MSYLHKYLYTMIQDSFVEVVAVAIILDTFLGCFRALMARQFNSSFGINGAIRKTAIMVSVSFLMLIDNIMRIDLIAFLPADLKAALGLSTIGIGGFFCILYIIYEAISILKNWYLIGLPSPPIFKKILTGFFSEITGEKDNSGNGVDNSGNSDKKEGAA